MVDAQRIWDGPAAAERRKRLVAERRMDGAAMLCVVTNVEGNGQEWAIVDW